MGIYKKTFLLYGFSVLKESDFSCETLKDIPKQWIFELSDRYYVFIPKTFKILASMNALIDANDLRQEYVSLYDLYEFKHIELNHFDILDDEKIKLEEYANKLNVTKSEIKKFIVESVWCTYNLVNINKLSFCKFLPIEEKHSSSIDDKHLNRFI